MFSEYVDGDTFNQRELDSDVFAESFNANEIDGYRRSKDSEEDCYNAWEYWDEKGLFSDWLEWRFEEYGYLGYDDNPQDGMFVWMQDYEQCVVLPGDNELPSDVVAMFDRDSLYETVYAEGIVHDGVFYATTIARELD